MKKGFSILIALMVILTAIVLPLSSVFAAESDFEYKVLSETDKTCQITRYNGHDTDLLIPSKINGYSVIEIDKAEKNDEGVFSYRDSLISISIPDSVTRIGEKAFYYCNNLREVNMPNTITSIGNEAFVGTQIYNNKNNWDNGVLYIGNYLIIALLNDYDTKKYSIKEGTLCVADLAFYNSELETVTIPSSLISLGSGLPFYSYDRNSLKNIYVDSNNVNYCDENGILFDKNKTKIIQYPNGKDEINYTIPSSVLEIGEYAFYNSSITNISIPQGVNNIGFSAFYKSDLYENKNNWENGVLYIENWLIEAENSLAGQHETKLNTIGIADNAFGACKDITNITLPNTISIIGNSAFYNCESLETITIPSSVTQIGNDIFEGCYNLKEVYYDGKESNWNKIYLQNNENAQLDSFTIHYKYGTDLVNDTINNTSSDLGDIDIGGVNIIIKIIINCMIILTAFVLIIIFIVRRIRKKKQ